MTKSGHRTRMAKLMLHGDLDHPATLSVADLREWTQHRMEVVFDCAADGPQNHVFEGALLRDVVAGAGPAFDARRRKDRSRFLLAVSGGDGHHTVLAWAELDEDFGDSPVLLATRLDGEELDEAGAQLVVPSDRCGARYVSAVTHVWFGSRWRRRTSDRAGRPGLRPGIRRWRGRSRST
ncbi:molybdopterin-dependent oxidoreductase [Streptomyces sp. 147326]|uniref:molybdopterin-dependent oxidoreductase n=1 Tax=Streptomyces sp. 147326 TaxID=3074379 RepID=UPI0038573C0E